jgi:hypothetical protein
MRASSVSICIIALASLAGAGCGGSGGDADACSGGNPGCSPAECAVSCVGPMYECVDGDWEPAGICEDPCVFDPVIRRPRTWTWTLTAETACTGVVPRSEAVFMTDGASVDLVAMSTDPDLVLTLTNVVDYGCTAVVSFDFTDVWLVDGIATTVAGSGEIDLANGAMSTTRGIVGELTATVGACELVTSIEGAFD